MTDPDWHSCEDYPAVEEKSTASDQVSRYLINFWLILATVGCLAVVVVCSLAWIFGGVGEDVVLRVAPTSSVAVWSLRCCVYGPGAVMIVAIFAYVRGRLRGFQAS